MRIALTTLGCKLNATETSAIERRLIEHEHEIVPFGENADVLIVNTCSVTDQADVECRKVIRRGLRGAPQAHVVVTGCYAQLKPNEILSIDGVTAVVGTSDKLRIPELLSDLIAPSKSRTWVVPPSQMIEFTPARSSRVNSRTRAFLKVQDGCDYSCSFCTIPLARGPARAMELSDVRNELVAIADEGFHECVISGINLGEYETSTGERLRDLLRMINAMQLPYRIRLGSIEPNTMSTEIIELIAQSPSIVPHVHLPLQSGSAEVLAAMRRRYNPQMYRSVLQNLYSAMPHIAVGIDVISGFPGETSANAEETIRFLSDVPWSYLHAFTYSERANTLASTMGVEVDVAERRERTRRLRELSAARTREFYHRDLGAIRQFLPEGYDATNETWTGWTENHIAVRFKGPADMEKKPITVRLLEVIADAVLVEHVDSLPGHVELFSNVGVS